ncbi:MAG: tetratricopeptide repeat protein, partial [Planctomycetales bacterium]
MEKRFPEPAAAMIAPAVNENDSQTPKYWFDQAVAAQFDYMPAYHTYLRALRPRTDAMHEFGRECAATKRYETEVPLFLFEVLKQIGILRREAGDETYRGPGVYDLIKETLTGTADSPARKNGEHHRPRRWVQSYHLRAAILAGQPKDVVALDQELGDQLDLSVFDYSQIRHKIYISRAYALTSNVGAQVRKAEDLIKTPELRAEPKNADDAWRLLNAVAEKCTQPRAKAFFSARIEELAWERKLHDGKTVLLKFEEGLPTWRPDGNAWKVIDPLTIEGDSGDKGGGLMLLSAARFSPPYVVEADVETLRSDKKSFLPGIMFGSQVADGQSLQRGRVVWANQHGVGAVIPGRAPRGLQGDYLKKVNRVTVFVWPREFIFYVNGKKHPGLEYAKGEGFLGLGSPRWIAASGKARVSNVSVRKLTGPPPDWFKKSPRVVEFYSDAILHHPELFDAYQQRGEAHFKLNQFAPALRDFLKHRELTGEPNRVEFGRVLAAQGFYEEAIRAFEAALRDKKRVHTAALALASLYAGAADPKVRSVPKALEMARRAESTARFLHAGIPVAFAMAHAEAGEWDKAAEHMNRAVKAFGANEETASLRDQFARKQPYRMEHHPGGSTLDLISKIFHPSDPPRGAPTVKTPVPASERGRGGTYDLKLPGVAAELYAECAKMYGAKLNAKTAKQVKAGQPMPAPGGKPPSWRVVAPDAKPNEPWGVLVFVGPTKDGSPPRPDWLDALKRKRLIYAGPNESGKFQKNFYRHA